MDILFAMRLDPGHRQPNLIFALRSGKKWFLENGQCVSVFGENIYRKSCFIPATQKSTHKFYEMRILSKGETKH